MKKQLLTAAVAIGLSALASIPAFAYGWQNDGLWWYGTNEDNTAWYSNGWQLIDGVYYYFDSNGYMYEGTMTPDGYFVDESGAWQVVSPAEAEDAYRKYRLYQYGPILDRRDYYVRYCVDDFNGDGVLDMLLTDMDYDIENYEEGKEYPIKVQLFTIQNGKVQLTDEFQKSDYTGIDGIYMIWYKGERLVVSFLTDTLNNAYTITTELKFQEKLPAYSYSDGVRVNIYDPDLWPTGNEFYDYIMAHSQTEDERKALYIPMYRLSYKWLLVSSLNSFNISGEENSVADQ